MAFFQMLAETYKMKLIIPPLVTIILTIVIDKLIDLIFGFGPYDDSGTPGIVFMIEAVMTIALIIIGVLIHGLLILRSVERFGIDGYKKIMKWGLSIIIIICSFYILVITKELNYSLSLQIQNGLILFFMLTFMLMIDLLTLKIIKKYIA